MKPPIDFDRPLGTGVWQSLPQVALFVILTLSMSLPAHKTCWKKLFDSPSVHSSAAKILLLKVLFVVQTILLSALSTDLIFQLAKDHKTPPVVPGLWISPVTFIAGIVLMITRSSLVMTHHLTTALSVAAIPSLVLVHAKFSPLAPKTLEMNMLCIYGVSMVAVFWQDIKHCIEERHAAGMRFPFSHLGEASAAAASKENIKATTPVVPHSEAHVQMKVHDKMLNVDVPRDRGLRQKNR